MYVSLLSEINYYYYINCIRASPRSHIVDTPVTEREFLEQLHELNHKINFVKEQSFKETRSSLDVRDILEKLKLKVLCKHYLN